MRRIAKAGENDGGNEYMYIRRNGIEDRKTPWYLQTSRVYADMINAVNLVWLGVDG